MDWLQGVGWFTHYCRLGKVQTSTYIPRGLPRYPRSAPFPFRTPRPFPTYGAQAELLLASKEFGKRQRGCNAKARAFGGPCSGKGHGTRRWGVHARTGRSPRGQLEPGPVAAPARRVPALLVGPSPSPHQDYKQPKEAGPGGPGARRHRARRPNPLATPAGPRGTLG